MTTAARIGISLLSGDRGIGPVELAQAVEQRGFESLWLPEHSHIPISRDTPWPGSVSGEPLPDVYSRLLDATVSLSMAAASTTRIRLGTSVLLLAARDPLWTAKEYATLDVLSGGRVEFGVGFGRNREELTNHGVDFRARWDHTREAVAGARSASRRVGGRLDADQRTPVAGEPPRSARRSLRTSRARPLRGRRDRFRSNDRPEWVVQPLR